MKLLFLRKLSPLGSHCYKALIKQNSVTSMLNARFLPVFTICWFVIVKPIQIVRNAIISYYGQPVYLATDPGGKLFIIALMAAGTAVSGSFIGPSISLLPIPSQTRLFVFASATSIMRE